MDHKPLTPPKRLMNAIRFFIWMCVMFYMVNALRRWLNSPTSQQRPRTSAPPPRPPFRASEPSPYQVLGVAPGSSQQEIRAAYQKLIQSYHPDQVAHLGDELREVAERRTKEINAAYSALKRRPQGS